MTLRASTGAVAVAAAGDVRSAYGRWHGPESLVCWASGSKVFVAGLARALVADGELDWDTGIGELLRTSAPAALTVGSLVTHRSGLPRVLPEQKPTLPDPYESWTTLRFDDRVMPDLARLAAAGTPGEVAYSNLGYALLARALEVTQGKDWLTLVRERLVEPLGAPGGSLVLAPPEGSRSPGPHTVSSRDLRGRPVPDWDVSTGPFSASGGLCSTIPAMVTILRSAVDIGSPLLPGDGPHAWERQDSRAWHAGALLRSGSLLVVDTRTTAVAAAHALGGAPGFGAQQAEKALDALVSAERPVAARGTS